MFKGLDRVSSTNSLNSQNNSSEIPDSNNTDSEGESEFRESFTSDISRHATIVVCNAEMIDNDQLYAKM